MSDYIVSARKYRPDSFESLIGQDNIARTLKNSILRGQLAHAYLFCGPRGVGKTSAARIFAKTINCSNPGADMEPCGQCESCLSFKEGRSYCIHELDAASNNGVDDIKALMDKVQIPPQVGKYSVYIIDEVHMLSSSAFNAFLKTLEEPPAHAIFILATTEKHKIIPTILSRCQTYDFNRISIPDIVGNLKNIASKENVSIDEESLHVIAQKADGAMRDALTIFDQTIAFCGTEIKYEDVIRNLNVLDYEYSFKMVDAFLSRNHGSALLIFDEILSKGFNAIHFMSSIGSHLRDLIVSKTGGLESLLDLPTSLKSRYSEQAGRCQFKFLFDALTIISQCEAGYRTAVNQRLHIEYALMKLSFLCGLPAESGAKTTSPATPAASVPAPTPAPTPVTTPAPVTVPTAVTPVSEPVQTKAAAQTKPAPQAKPTSPAPKTGAALSLSSLLEDDDDIIPADDIETSADEPKPLPADELILSSWKELAAMQSQPRLASALSNAELEISEDNGIKHVSFQVSNEAQKKWIEEKILRSLESQFQQMTSCSKIQLHPTVIEVEEKTIIYTQEEKARDLMAKNPEVAKFIAEFNLDIK